LRSHPGRRDALASKAMKAVVSLVLLIASRAGLEVRDLPEDGPVGGARRIFYDGM
jgi:hypothetical protein